MHPNHSRLGPNSVRLVTRHGAEAETGTVGRAHGPVSLSSASTSRSEPQFPIRERGDRQLMRPQSLRAVRTVEADRAGVGQGRGLLDTPVLPPSASAVPPELGTSPSLAVTSSPPFHWLQRLLLKFGGLEGPPLSASGHYKYHMAHLPPCPFKDTGMKNG